MDKNICWYLFEKFVGIDNRFTLNSDSNCINHICHWSHLFILNVFFILKYVDRVRNKFRNIYKQIYLNLKKHLQDTNNHRNKKYFKMPNNEKTVFLTFLLITCIYYNYTKQFWLSPDLSLIWRADIITKSAITVIILDLFSNSQPRSSQFFLKIIMVRSSDLSYIKDFINAALRKTFLPGSYNISGALAFQHIRK